jgi:hypothetical protein
MISKNEVLTSINKYQKIYSFKEGYKILYCPWDTIGKSDVAFISLNPGKPPNSSELQLLSDERGNSYEVEKYTTKSPLTKQFLKMCKFINRKPSSILTGVACPFRGDRWSDFSKEQKKAGLEIGRKFWSKVLDDKIKMIITLGNEVTKLITDIKDAQIELTINSGWGNNSLRRYKSNDNVEIIQLLHLSTFKIFSSINCKEPLKKIFENFN